MSDEVMNIFLAVFYIVSVVLIGVFFSWFTIQRRKNAEAMRKNIYTKISSGIEINSKDVSHIGRAFGLSAYQSRQVIYKIYSEANGKEDFEKLKGLVLEIEKEEPFDDLPDEVKPSMIRLTKIASESGEESDKHLLSPIAQTLNKYVDLKSDQEKLKKQTNRAYVVTVISFVFGAVGTYYTVTGPSAADIAAEIQKHGEIIENET